MADTRQDYEQHARQLWHGSERQDAVAQLEAALQLQPNQADEWCRLGESYYALACEATDRETASMYREKAISALTQAITLSPRPARAHYALANIYRAQDIRLALVEFEAAAACDPQQYGDALVHARKVVQDCTYRLGDLNLIVMDSVQEEPVPQILQTEFWFEDQSISSAVMHACVSQDGRQYVKAWLFGSAKPDLSADEPVAEVMVSSTGSVSLSRGCPADYRKAEAEVSPAPAPEPVRRSGALVWLPLGMVVGAAGAGLVAYFTLIAPASGPLEKSVRAEREAPLAAPPRAATDSKPDAAPTSLEPQSLPFAHGDTAAPAIRVTTIQTPNVIAQPGPPPSVRTTSEAKLRSPTISQPHAQSSPADSLKAPPAQSRQASEQVVPPPVRQPEPSATADDVAMSAGTAETAPIETNPLPRTEHSAAVPAVRKEQLAMVPPPQRAQPAAPSNWVRRMRAQLHACGKPGIWRNDLCREAVRWNYCEPSRWNTVRDCSLEQFASAGVSD